MTAGRRSLGIALTLLLAASVVHARYAGRPLAEALRALQTQGLKLIYSDDVVRPEMIVTGEPRAKTPRRILDELLHEHLLHVESGPQGTLLIVRDERTAAPPRAAPLPKPEMPVALAEIVVTPSRFTLLADAPESRQFLDRDEVRRLPHLADDVYRAIIHLPGTAGTDVSARFHLRGGTQDEVLVLVDGAEIYDPFHVKDLFRAFSTIDAEAVGSVDVLSGGYPVEYGGRMSGVVDISTLAPEATRTEAGISLLTTRLLSQGKFGDGRGTWLLSARRGYLREVLQLVDNSSGINPRYYDVLGKVEWTLGSRAVVSAHLLATRDKLHLREDPGTDAHASYRDQYGWVQLRASVTPRLFTQSVISFGSLDRERRGYYQEFAATTSGTLNERREAHVASWKNDASFDLSPRTVLRGGFTAKSVRARYDYEGSSHIQFSNFALGAPPRDVVRSAHLSPDGHELSAYVASRTRLSERLVAEVGLRAAEESYTPDGVHLDPRVQLAWAPAAGTAVRVAWGVVHQSQRIDELPVEDGVTEFDAAQRSVHRVASVEQQLPRGAHARLELYDKSITSVRPRFENLYDGLELFPELRADRIAVAPRSAHARGAELLVRSDASRPVSAWASYALSSVTDEIEGRDVPRAWDQRHAATFSVNVRRGTAWNLNLAGTWHSGWPTTPVLAHLENGRIVSTTGARNADRLPAYTRLDLRATRSFRRVDFFVELFNVLNRSNVARVDSFSFTTSTNGVVTTSPITESIIGVIPSFGLTWRF
jgi:hypothetical protein